MISVLIKTQFHQVEIFNEGPHAAAGILLDVLTGNTNVEVEDIETITINPHAKDPSSSDNEE